MGFIGFIGFIGFRVLASFVFTGGRVSGAADPRPPEFLSGLRLAPCGL